MRMGSAACFFSMAWGAGCHLGYEFVRRAKEAGIECCLPIPKTSAEAQGEDTVHFRVLQPKFRSAKRQ